MRNNRMYVKQDTRFKRYMRRTWHNKLIAIGLFVAGLLYAKVAIEFGDTRSDCTFAVFLWLLSVIMFFARTDWREL